MWGVILSHKYVECVFVKSNSIDEVRNLLYFQLKMSQIIHKIVNERCSQPMETDLNHSDVMKGRSKKQFMKRV